MKGKNLYRMGAAIVVSVLGIWTLVGPNLVLSAETSGGKNLAERRIEMGVEYPGIVISQDESVGMDVTFYNRGRFHEEITVWVAEVPSGWEARLKTYRYDITGIFVPSDSEKTLTFEAEPPDGIAPGQYVFRIAARTADGKYAMDRTLTVHVEEKKSIEKKYRGVKITTSYPVLQGPSDARFEFSIEVESKLDNDAVFELFAQGPEGWNVNFKPAYESKYISSLRLKANQSSPLAVEVKPPVQAAAGEYPLTIRVSSGDAEDEAKLTVTLTGTYELEVGTPTGILSLSALQGKPAGLTFYIKNTGSAANHDIKFMSFKPENWKVEFRPETIASIESGELKQVEMTITPGEEALVGDYSVNVGVEGEKVSKNLEFRVTVKASSAWGWIGIGIIVFVVIGLTGLFRWLGRR